MRSLLQPFEFILKAEDVPYLQFIYPFSSSTKMRTSKKIFFVVETFFFFYI